VIFGGVNDQLTGVAPLRFANRDRRSLAAAAFAIAQLAGR
jgi:hypothetical protein